MYKCVIRPNSVSPNRGDRCDWQAELVNDKGHYQSQVSGLMDTAAVRSGSLVRVVRLLGEGYWRF